MRWVAKLAWMTGIILPLITATPIPMVFAEEANEQESGRLYFKRMAVAPFLVGHRQPQMDAAMDDTLSCPLDQICTDDPSIAPEAGTTLTRLVQAAMHKRFTTHLINRSEVNAGYANILINGAKDTPRSLARQLGQALSADLMLMGVVWRYRHREPPEGPPENPASVAFAIYLVEVETGRRLWRGIYNGTQSVASQNIFNLSKQLKMGVRWLSAAELALHGVGEALETFPNGVAPLTNDSK